MIDAPEVSRNTRLDSLRGFAALFVFIHHFLLVFYPALFTGQSVHSHTQGNTESHLAYSWLAFLWNGNFAVCIFFVLSGYALSLRFFSGNHNFLATVEGILKRYPRLVLPVLGSVLLSWLILSLNGYSNISVAQVYTHNDFWFSNLWNITPDLPAALREAFLDSVLYGGTLEYNPVLWTINMEFFGSLLVFACLPVLGVIRNRQMIYVLLAVILCKTYFLAFVLGMTLCDYHHSVYFRRLPAVIAGLMMALAFYGGGFHWLRFLPAKEWGVLEYLTATGTQIVYILSSAVLLLAVISIGKLPSGFFSRTGNRLGKISFSMYLLHLLIIGSFSCRILRALIDHGTNYHAACAIIFSLTLLLVLGASYLYYHFVDKPSIRLGRIIYTRFFRRNPETTSSKEISATSRIGQ